MDIEVSAPMKPHPDSDQAMSMATSEKDQQKQPASSSTAPSTVTLIAKWGKQKFEVNGLPSSLKIYQVKEMISEKTNVLPKRQKLIGLTTVTKAKVTDQTLLSELKPKSSKSTSISESGVKEIRHNFILMGTPEEQIFIDPSNHDDLPEVVDDFDLDFNAGTQEWHAHVATGQNLKKFTESTAIHIMHEPREGKPLMVLDLDHTLLDFSRKSIEQASTAERNGNGEAVGMASTQETIDRMKRPYMDEFLAKAYKSYDLVVWSQTSWRWLETKLIELGMLTNTRYRFCFVLDKTSMFAITSTSSKSGRKVKHYVKPLQIIWNKFPKVWGPHNTVHLDDLSRNFALNPENGLKVTAFYRKKKAGKRDVELVGLSNYLERLAVEVKDFTTIKMKYWQDVISGKKALIASKSDVSKEQNNEEKTASSKPKDQNS
jgi:ubiquitin-like domain-containing CTD phosphatase 1